MATARVTDLQKANNASLDAVWTKFLDSQVAVMFQGTTQHGMQARWATEVNSIIENDPQTRDQGANRVADLMQLIIHRIAYLAKNEEPAIKGTA